MTAKSWLLLLTLLASSCDRGRSELVPASDARVAVMGRVDRSRPGSLRFGYPGVTLRVRFEGRTLGVRAECTTPNCRLAVLVDGKPSRVLALAEGTSDLIVAENLAEGAHTIELSHGTETWRGIVTVHGFLPGGGLLLAPTPWPERRLLFIGDSVTCGEAADRAAACRNAGPGGWDAWWSYGMVTARALGAQAQLVCYGGRGLVRDWEGKRDVLNAPQFFDLSVPDPERPTRWDHSAYVPDAVIVSLGTNDFNLGLGALPEREPFVSAYVDFVRAIRGRYPKAQLFLTEGAIVNDEADPARPQKTRLREYLRETAARAGDPGLRVVPAQHYPGDACDPHPTRAQHAAMAGDLTPVIRDALGWR